MIHKFLIFIWWSAPEVPFPAIRVITVEAEEELKTWTVAAVAVASRCAFDWEPEPL